MLPLACVLMSVVASMSAQMVVADGSWQSRVSGETLVLKSDHSTDFIRSALDVYKSLKASSMEVGWKQDVSKPRDPNKRVRNNGTEAVGEVYLVVVVSPTQAQLWNKDLGCLNAFRVMTESLTAQNTHSMTTSATWCMTLMLLLLPVALTKCIRKQTQDSKNHDLRHNNVIHENQEQSFRHEDTNPISKQCGKERRLSQESKMQFDKLEFLETIGSGSFKTVYRGKWGANQVAIVRMQAGGLVTEAPLLERISCHPNLVTFYRWTRDGQGNEYVIMELMPMGSLDSVLRRHPGRLSVKQKTTICAQICHAMLHLAAENVLHRDLAARNVLVQSLHPVSVKVTDFGLAKNARTVAGGKRRHRHKSSSMSGVLPVRWVPPEVLQDGAWSEKSDVWAYGVTMWEIFSDGLEPYNAEFSSEMEVMDYILQGGTLRRPHNCPEFIFNLMSQCWRFDPRERPSFEHLWEALARQELLDSDDLDSFPLDQKENSVRNVHFRPRMLQERILDTSSLYSRIKDVV